MILISMILESPNTLSLETRLTESLASNSPIKVRSIRDKEVKISSQDCSNEIVKYHPAQKMLSKIGRKAGYTKTRILWSTKTSIITWSHNRHVTLIARRNNASQYHRAITDSLWEFRAVTRICNLLVNNRFVRGIGSDNRS